MLAGHAFRRCLYSAPYRGFLIPPLEVVVFDLTAWCIAWVCLCLLIHCVIQLIFIEEPDTPYLWSKWMIRFAAILI